MTSAPRSRSRAPHPNHRDPSTLPLELRRPGVPVHVRAWVERSAGRRLQRIERLDGASSTAVHRLHFDDGPSLVLRRYAWPGLLEDEPVLAVRERDALQFASERRLPAPELVAVDVTGADVGDGVPVFLMTSLAGRALAAPDTSRLAEVAATLHAADSAGFGHDYFRWFEGDAGVAPPTNARDPRVWERAFEYLAATSTLPGRVAFIHRDLHPGNIVWSRGRCSGVVDWGNACRGPIGCDIATCRGELIRLAGFDAADRFRDACESLTGDVQDRYWELQDVIEHGPSPWTEAQIDASEERLARALGDLGVSR